MTFTLISTQIWRLRFRVWRPGANIDAGSNPAKRIKVAKFNVDFLWRDFVTRVILKVSLADNLQIFRRIPAPSFFYDNMFNLKNLLSGGKAMHKLYIDSGLSMDLLNCRSSVSFCFSLSFDFIVLVSNLNFMCFHYYQ